MRSIEDYIAEMQADSVMWFGEVDLTAMVLGLVGESGEVADQLKKHIRGSKTYDQMREKIIVELIDVFHYWCLLVGYFDIDVDEVYRKKREFNLERYERFSEPPSTLWAASDRD